MSEHADRSPDNASIEATIDLCRESGEETPVSRRKVIELAESVLALRAELERVKQEEVAHRGVLAQELEHYKAGLKKLRDAEAELARLRPVVEAAKAWCDAPMGNCDAECEALIQSVDALRAQEGA